MSTEWIKMWSIYTMKYYSALKKNKRMSSAATWMDLEIIKLSEISKRKTNIMWCHLYVGSKEGMVQMSLLAKQKLSHGDWKQACG